ncbi:MAG: methionine--tRNA ligase [Deltaproteobacteria bacterium]|nr:methionine--tRNA ligase [Deltaproteobacteria bacterium]
MEKISIEVFKKVNLVVGKIISCDDVPNSNKLYRMQVDLGPYGKRQILAGLKGFYDQKELEGKKIVVVENIEPAKIAGQVSEGMLLAVESNGSAYVLEPFFKCSPGDKVY